MSSHLSKEIISDDIVINKIYHVRSSKVMLDSDLAQLYGIETRTLNQAVKRNVDRFPEEFMFQLSEEELSNLISQSVISSWGGRRKLPYVFTEHGVLMLSCILNSRIAIQVNLQIVRIFIKFREAVSENNSLKFELEEIKTKLDNHDKSIELVFSYLDELVESKENPKPRKRIGYMPDEIS